MSKKIKNLAEQIDTEFKDVSKAELGASSISLKNEELPSSKAILDATPLQSNLFHVEKQVVVNEIEMGVLESGVPYLTGRGLERMCGVGHGPFYKLTSEWNEEKTKPRGKAITQLLEEAHYYEEELFIYAEHNGQVVSAFTEPVCLALLEYFAFVTDKPREQAINAFRTLAKTKFREYIYNAVGYSPERKILDSWKHFHDRIDMTLDAVPIGYFSVFREIASMIVPMIRSGIMISDKVVPDISVGKIWSKFWVDGNLDDKYGKRINYNHAYPLYYPAAKSNPQPAYAYPDDALGLFRHWLRESYIATKFPTYLARQIKSDKIPQLIANKALEALAPKQIENKTDNSK